MSLEDLIKICPICLGFYSLVMGFTYYLLRWKELDKRQRDHQYEHDYGRNRFCIYCGMNVECSSRYWKEFRYDKRNQELREYYTGNLNRCLKAGKDHYTAIEISGRDIHWKMQQLKIRDFQLYGDDF
jgi:hypothetical protein